MVVTDKLSDLALQLSLELGRQSLKMATAESCTGGWVSQVLTAIPGSSDWFEGAVVSYSNAMKHRLLDVPCELLDKYGAVSQPVVEQMARGVAMNLDVPVSIAISGIAGPGGGSRDKPVGTVHIAWYCREKTFSEAFRFAGDRQQVREQSVEVALSELIRLLQQSAT
ncbi:nicotinamide-nucleotide amidase [Endozoicomonas sp. NE40]|uniref:Nicotinamide-nucleotide amidase n=1 Tax=Endozoicomonas lisbonensis TaxID=3120522 RepID=A0ABV2SBW9_9GAMM